MRDPPRLKRCACRPETLALELPQMRQVLNEEKLMPRFGRRRAALELGLEVREPPGYDPKRHAAVASSSADSTGMS